ncbi:FkbM family methyltransferase [Devosia sp. A16]|uniref:FkbM family methyltransferase n=1 Tax=Devosia sp. A16 TaxID=1736675 RepID=UPI0006D7D3C2|nr:FkbM family methyltransferase [Devosia sp. A16]
MKLLEFTGLARLHHHLFTLAYHAHEAELELVAGLPRAVRRVMPHWPDRAALGIDIGAGTGPYGRKLMRHCDEVVLVEPNHEQAEYLRRSFGASAQVVEAAAGRAAGTALLVDAGAGGWRRPLARLGAAADGKGWQQACRVETVDGICERLGLMGRPGAIVAKIDVEGAEQAVLEGMPRLLADRPALLIIEIEARLNPDYAGIFSLLAGQGFGCFVYEAGRLQPGGPEQAAAMLTRSPGRFGRLNSYRSNFVFLR